MSRRLDILNAVVTKLGTLIPGVPASIYEGDEKVFNPSDACPALFVEYTGRQSGINETIGSVHQARKYLIAVYFNYDNLADCLAALEAAEDGLPGVLGTTDRLVEHSEIPEALLATADGKMLFAQFYQVHWDD